MQYTKQNLGCCSLSTRKTPLIDSITSLNDCEFSGAPRPSAKGTPGHPDPEIRERKGFSKKFLFSALRASLCSKKRGWGRGRPPRLLPWALLLDLPLELACACSWRDSGRQVRYVVSWINGSPFALPRKKPRAQQSRQLGRLTASRPIKGGKLVAKLMHSTGFDLWTYHFSHMGKNIVLSLIG